MEKSLMETKLNIGDGASMVDDTFVWSREERDQLVNEKERLKQENDQLLRLLLRMNEEIISVNNRDLHGMN
eukprot:gene6306-8685_t